LRQAPLPDSEPEAKQAGEAPGGNETTDADGVPDQFLI